MKHIESPRTHALCSPCYRIAEPGREPNILRSIASMRSGDRAICKCCKCGLATDAGIFYRAEPNAYQCEGGTK